jgi:hypothetical protein
LAPCANYLRASFGRTRDFERANRASTNAAAHRIFEKWAEEFRSALDVAHVNRAETNRQE